MNKSHPEGKYWKSEFNRSPPQGNCSKYMQYKYIIYHCFEEESLPALLNHSAFSSAGKLFEVMLLFN
jgi:hypothetical protein